MRGFDFLPKICSHLAFHGCILDSRGVARTFLTPCNTAHVSICGTLCACMLGCLSRALYSCLLFQPGSILHIPYRISSFLSVWPMWNILSSLKPLLALLLHILFLCLVSGLCLKDIPEWADELDHWLSKGHRHSLNPQCHGSTFLIHERRRRNMSLSWT